MTDITAGLSWARAALPDELATMAPSCEETGWGEKELHYAAYKGPLKFGERYRRAKT